MNLEGKTLHSRIVRNLGNGQNQEKRCGFLAGPRTCLSLVNVLNGDTRSLTTTRLQRQAGVGCKDQFQTFARGFRSGEKLVRLLLYAAFLAPELCMVVVSSCVIFMVSFVNSLK